MITRAILFSTQYFPPSWHKVSHTSGPPYSTSASHFPQSEIQCFPRFPGPSRSDAPLRLTPPYSWRPFPPLLPSPLIPPATVVPLLPGMFPRLGSASPGLPAWNAPFGKILLVNAIKPSKPCLSCHHLNEFSPDRPVASSHCSSNPFYADRPPFYSIPSSPNFHIIVSLFFIYYYCLSSLSALEY